VLNASGHIAYVNSKALELAKITKNTPDPKGAQYGRYADGSPNGVLYGVIAHLPVMLLNQAIVNRMNTGFVDAGIEVGDQAAALGVTTLCDMAAGAFGDVNDIKGFHQMYATGRMKTRVRAYLFDGKAEEWDKSGVEPGYDDAYFRVSGWKMVVDGSNQGYTGRQREPYFGKDTKGIFYVEPRVLNEHVLKRAKQGWPLALHGNGDAAIDAILDALENAQHQGVDIKSLRCRIEHCSILHDGQIARCKAIGVEPSFLINHVYYWGHVMRDKVFGPEKVQLLDRCGSVDKAGLTWTMHTDAPVSPLGHLHMIRVAVVRDMWEEPDTILARKSGSGSKPRFEPSLEMQPGCRIRKTRSAASSPESSPTWPCSTVIHARSRRGKSRTSGSLRHGWMAGRSIGLDEASAVCLGPVRHVPSEIWEDSHPSRRAVTEQSEPTYDRGARVHRHWRRIGEDAEET
jgi:predicted amidohydrolase YtcJ